MTGLTEISDVSAYKEENGERVPSNGRLYYQGYDVSKLIDGLTNRKFGFEETIYLLLFGKLPSETEFEDFRYVMGGMQNLNNRFIRDVVMKASNPNVMNAMQRCVLTLYTYDSNPDDISTLNVLRQSLELINKQAFDQSGLIYGMGHAVYTLSDPREVILKDFAKKLSEEKGLEEELMNGNKIIRPAYKYVGQHVEYEELSSRMTAQ